MKPERLLPSQLERVELGAKSGNTVTSRRLVIACAEIRACWSEIELLRPIAIAAAERIASHPEDGTVLADAVEAWQKANRKKSE